MSLICSVCRSHNPVLSFSSMTYHQILTRETQQVSLIEQELLTILEYLSSSSVFSGVRVAQSFVVCVVFCGSMFFVVVLFLFGHFIVCSSLNYHF